MAGQSALLTGFAYGGISVSREIEGDVNLFFIQMGYLVTTVAAMGFGLMTIVISSLVSMLGPGLALRGSEGPVSMHKAVDTMKEESTKVF